jgi:hypothetical protein
MNLASNLINANTRSDIIPNVKPKPNVIYNPDIPVKSDINNNSIREQRQIKLKDRYYVDNLLTSQVKNNGTLSLGDTTSKYSKFGDIDRSIDVNNLRRRNVENTKYTLPDDYYNGSYSAYYSIPRTVRKPIKRTVNSMTAPIMPLSSMNNLNYKNQFNIPKSTSNIIKPMTKNIDFDKWLYNNTDDTEIIEDDDDKDNENVNDDEDLGLSDYDLDKIYLDRQKTIYDKNYGRDKYGRPIIKGVRNPIITKDKVKRINLNI